MFVYAYNMYVKLLMILMLIHFNSFDRVDYRHSITLYTCMLVLVDTVDG